MIHLTDRAWAIRESLKLAHLEQQEMLHSVLGTESVVRLSDLLRRTAAELRDHSPQLGAVLRRRFERAGEELDGE